jgi:hypothetical protein
MDANRTIALIYHRVFGRGDQLEDDLAWLIASKLKGVGFSSRYNPLSDPDVLPYLKRLRALARD